MATYRLDFAFQAGDMRLTRIAASNQPAPGSDPIVPAGTGFWLTVHNKDGLQTHAQILRDPRTGDAAAGVTVPDQPGWAFAPDPGEDGFVVFHMAFPSQSAGAPAAPTPTPAGVRVAVFPLKAGTGLNILGKLMQVFQKPHPAVWLLIVGDGFGPGEAGKFDDFAAAMTKRLCGMEPFHEHEDALRAGIVSTLGPSTPGGGFDWVIDDLPGRKLMKVNGAKAMSYIAQTLKLDPVNVLVVLNKDDYGGSGGDPAVTGLGKLPGDGDGSYGRDNAIHAAIHELGHSAFALADEYDLAARGYSTAPVELNVAHDKASVRAKWGDLLKPADVDLDLPTPVSAGPEVVGMFQGAKYDPVHNFRSQLTCRMRDVNQPFCAACRQVIKSVLDCEL